MFLFFVQLVNDISPFIDEKNAEDYFFFESLSFISLFILSTLIELGLY